MVKSPFISYQLSVGLRENVSVVKPKPKMYNDKPKQGCKTGLEKLYGCQAPEN